MNDKQMEYISFYEWKSYITTASSIYEWQCLAMVEIKKKYPRRKIYGNDIGTRPNTQEWLLDSITYRD